MTPEITEAELDEIESTFKTGDSFTRAAAAWKALGALRACRKEAKAKDAALQEIKDNQGKVCAGFELCTHPACTSSYTSWAIADAALDKGDG